jgi:methionine-R-sulfoxide reductase
MEYKKPTQEELKKKLTKEQYEITQNEQTERPFDNEYWNSKKEGIYADIVTGEPLFSSLDKYDSGSGWPAFTKHLDNIKVIKNIDKSLGMERTEVKSKAGSHLGHIFPDGPINKGGQRYCINSGSLKFIPKEELKKRGFEEYTKEFDK